MRGPIILSDTDAIEANSVFDHWLTNEPVTLLVVLGSDPIAKMALSKSDELINSGDINYHSSRVILATNTSLIKNKLKKLLVNPKLNRINWSALDQYVILSISNKFNNIGSIVLKTKFPNQPRGYINRIIRKAQVNDIDLS
ncbi:hypothetical protein [Aquimarina sp. MMG016]|uniref:hypothetical protein n=1 Tax=Aquimarina sp. MMG016 TaxID=2822690 RepID=UPI001B3A542C|nr:hypothetical protein [Aquimarina sp. MMG016]MBQ4819363.1 hypothetical protein [Aquimarina sp. MMG016]